MKFLFNLRLDSGPTFRIDVGGLMTKDGLEDTPGRNGHIILPCFYAAGFSLHDYPRSVELQIERTQVYLDSHPDDAYVELTASILYNMDVYH